MSSVVAHPDVEPLQRLVRLADHEVRTNSATNGGSALAVKTDGNAMNTVRCAVSRPFSPALG
jgi:hypothetical protein